jgi:5,10-methenyltetrahydromethanopterin hydrogenase
MTTTKTSAAQGALLVRIAESFDGVCFGEHSYVKSSVAEALARKGLVEIVWDSRRSAYGRLHSIPRARLTVAGAEYVIAAIIVDVMAATVRSAVSRWGTVSIEFERSRANSSLHQLARHMRRRWARYPEQLEAAEAAKFN